MGWVVMSEREMRRIKVLSRVTQAAIEAYRAGDYLGLHRALGLRPWQPSSLPLASNRLGVDLATLAEQSGWPKGWQLARDMQRARGHARGD